MKAYLAKHEPLGPNRREVMTIYLPMSVRTFSAVQQAMEAEFPDAVLAYDKVDATICHIFDRPIGDDEVFTVAPVVTPKETQA